MSTRTAKTALTSCALALVASAAGAQAATLPAALDVVDPTLFAGRWFQVGVSEDQFKFQPKPLCASVNFFSETAGRDGSKTAEPWLRYKATQQTAKQIGTKTSFIVYGNVTQKKTPGTPNHNPSAPLGELNVHFDNNTLYPGQIEFDSSERVVHLEMDADGNYDFAILTNGIKGGSNDWTTVFVLAREPDWETKYGDVLETFTANFGTAIYHVPNGNGCYYDGPAGVAPPPVEKLDEVRFAGRWYQHRIDIRQFSFQGGINSKCASNLFTQRTDSTTGRQYVSNLGSAQIGDDVGTDKFKISRSAITPAADGSGQTSVYFPPGDLFPNSPAITASEWVVDVGGPEGQPYEWHIATDGPKYSAIFLNTRSPTLDPEILAHFNAFVDTTHFWQNVVNQEQPSNCKYAAPPPGSDPNPKPKPDAPPKKPDEKDASLGVGWWVIICLLCSSASAGGALFYSKRAEEKKNRASGYISMDGEV